MNCENEKEKCERRSTFSKPFAYFSVLCETKPFNFLFNLLTTKALRPHQFVKDLNMLLLQEAYFNLSTSVNSRLNALLNRGCQLSDTCLRGFHLFVIVVYFCHCHYFVIVEDTRTIRQLANIVKLLTLGHHCMTIKIFKFRVSSANSEGKISQTVYFCDLCLAVLSHRL